MITNEFDDARENHAENVPARETVAQVDGTPSLRRARRWALAAGILAGLLAFAVGEATYDLIPAENGKIPTMNDIVRRHGRNHGGRSNAERCPDLQRAGHLSGRLPGDRRRPCETFAGRGNACGRTGSHDRRGRSAGLSLALIPLFLKIQTAHLDYELIIAALMHGTIWGPIGAAAGLAFAVGLGERRSVGRMLATGLAGAVLGTIAYDLIAAFVFPLANTAEPISTTWPSRLLAQMLVAVATAAALGAGLRPPHRSA